MIKTSLDGRGYWPEPFRSIIPYWPETFRSIIPYWPEQFRPINPYWLEQFLSINPYWPELSRYIIPYWPELFRLIIPFWPGYFWLVIFYRWYTSISTVARTRTSWDKLLTQLNCKCLFFNSSIPLIAGLKLRKNGTNHIIFKHNGQYSPVFQDTFIQTTSNLGLKEI